MSVILLEVLCLHMWCWWRVLKNFFILGKFQGTLVHKCSGTVISSEWYTQFELFYLSHINNTYKQEHVCLVNWISFLTASNIFWENAGHNIMFICYPSCIGKSYSSRKAFICELFTFEKHAECTLIKVRFIISYIGWKFLLT